MMVKAIRQIRFRHTEDEETLDMTLHEMTAVVGRKVVATLTAYTCMSDGQFIPDVDGQWLYSEMDNVSCGAEEVALAFNAAVLAGTVDADDVSEGFVLIERLEVDPAHRGSKLGHRLMDELAARLPRDLHVGLKAFPLERDHNDPAMVAELARYYSSHGRSAFVTLPGGVMIGRWKSTPV